ncbi:hypothetical protein VNO78_17832 [Psophocarpus tetragonolobus]|uniref:Uncharacterized protein n=1 Tax=Psophocarpus tetragonolobus TaxID=3891 RepID=A0AAN9XLA2_PSOTE
MGLVEERVTGWELGPGCVMSSVIGKVGYGVYPTLDGATNALYAFCGGLSPSILAWRGGLGCHEAAG